MLNFVCVGCKEEFKYKVQEVGRCPYCGGVLAAGESHTRNVEVRSDGFRCEHVWSRTWDGKKKCVLCNLTFDSD